MKHRTVRDIQDTARVLPAEPDSAPASRRSRLERFAMLLERHEGPFRLLSRIEYLPEARRQSLRVEDSPLTIAYADPVFRIQGLASDQFGDAIRFFNLTPREAHHLLCDCHYGMAATSQMVACRARALARKTSFGEFWQKVRSGVLALWRG
jgi:hypothetical protein